MNTYSDNLLKQFTVKRGILHYITGPFSGRPAGHVRPNGVRCVRFNGVTYRHDELLFLYTQQLESKQLETIDTKQRYQTINGHDVHFYNTMETAPPYTIHGAVRIHGQRHACQWTSKGEAPNVQYNLTTTKGNKA